MSDITGGDEVIDLSVRGEADLDNVIKELNRLESKLEGVQKAARRLSDTKIDTNVSAVTSQLGRLRDVTENTGVITDATKKSIASIDRTIGGIDTNLTKARKGMVGFTKDVKHNKEEFSKWKKQMHAAGAPIKVKEVNFDLFKKNMAGIKDSLNDPMRSTIASMRSIQAMDGGHPVFSESLKSGEKLKVQATVLKKQLTGLFYHIRNQGKEAQWAGMQLIQGMTLPIVAGATMALNSFMSISKEFLQVKKLTDTFGNPEEFKKYEDGINSLAGSFGVTQKAAAGMYKDIAALGINGAKNVGAWAESIAKLQMIGEIDTTSATEFFRVTNTLFAGGSLDETNGLMEKFNAIADDTSLQLVQLSEAFPQAGPVMKQMGFTAVQTAAALAGMFQAGVDTKEGANGLKTAMTRLAAPTGRTKEIFDQLGYSFYNVDGSVGNAQDKLTELARLMKGLSQKDYAEVANSLFGKHQIARMSIYFDSVVKGQAEIDAAMADGEMTYKETQAFQSDWARAMVAGGEEAVVGMMSASERYKLAVENFQKDPSVAWANMKAKFGVVMYKLGAIISPMILEWGDRLVSFLERVMAAPQPLLKFAAAFAAVLAAAGPVLYIIGQIKNATAAFGLAITKVMPGMKDLMPADAMKLLKEDPNRKDIKQVGDAYLQDKRRFSKFRKSPAKTVSADDIVGVKAMDGTVEDLAASERDLAVAIAAATASFNAQAAAMAEVAAASQVLDAADNSPIDLVDMDSMDASRRGIDNMTGAVGELAETAAETVGNNGVAKAVDDIASPKKASGISRVSDKILGLAGGMGKMGLYGLGISAAIGVIAGVVITLIGGFKFLKENWDYFYAGMKPGIDAIKAGFQAIKDAVASIGTQMGDVIGSIFGGDGENDPKVQAMTLGEIVGKVATKIGQAMQLIAAVIKWTWPFWERMAYIARDVVGFISALFSGDWATAFEFAKAAVYELVRPFWVINQQIIGAMITLASTIANILSGIAGMMAGFLGWLGSIPIIGKIFGPLAAGAKAGAEALQGYFTNMRTNIDGLGTKVSQSIGDLDDRFRTGLNGSIGSLDKELAEQIDLQNYLEALNEANDLGGDLGDAINDGAADATDVDEWLPDWLSKIKTRLDKAVDDIRKSATEAMEAYQSSVLATYDERIKVIDDTEAAEEKLFKTEEYLAKKRELMRKRDIGMLNYQNARALAIYEGRIDDARMLDLDYQKDTEDLNQDLTDVETDRQKDLLKEQRDAMREKISLEKEAAQKTFDIQKKAFEEQLALITEYAPRNIDEFNKMLSSVDGLLEQYGVTTWPETARGGMERFLEVFRQANEDIRHEFFWSGKDPAAMWMAAFIASDTLEMMRKMGEQAGNAGGQGMGSGVGGGYDETVPDTLPLPELELPDFGEIFSNMWGEFTGRLDEGWKKIKQWIWDNILGPMVNMFIKAYNKIAEIVELLPGDMALPKMPEVEVDFGATPDYQFEFAPADAMSEQEKNAVGASGRTGRAIQNDTQVTTQKLTGYYDQAKASVTGNFADLKTAFANTSEAIAMGGIGASASVTTSFGEATGNVVVYSDNLGNHWKKTADGLVNQYGQSGKAITDASGRVTGIMNQNTGQMATEFTNKAVGMGATFGFTASAIGQRSGTMGTEISRGTQTGTEGSKGHMDGLKSHAWNVTTGISSAWDLVKSTLASPLSIIGNPFSILLQKFKDLVGKIWEAVKDGPLGSVVDFFGDAWNKLNAVRLAAGGKIAATNGGVPSLIGEGGYDEYVISTDPSKMSRSMGLMSQLMGDLGLTGDAKNMSAGKMSVRLPSSSYAVQGTQKSSGASGLGRRQGDTIIVVDNFIGEEAWFNELMAKHDIKVGSSKRNSSGQQKRVISTYNDRYRMQP